MILAYVIVAILPLHLQYAEKPLPGVSFDTEAECWDNVDSLMGKMKEEFGTGVALTWRCGEDT